MKIKIDKINQRESNKISKINDKMKSALNITEYNKIIYKNVMLILKLAQKFK